MEDFACREKDLIPHLESGSRRNRSTGNGPDMFVPHSPGPLSISRYTGMNLDRLTGGTCATKPDEGYACSSDYTVERDFMSN